MKKLVQLVSLIALALLFIMCTKGNGLTRGLGSERGAGTKTGTAAVSSADHKKYALVIGNEAYTGITKLKNSVNDANDITIVLESMGFTVDKVLNGTLDQMEKATARLKNRLSAEKSSYGFFFYAGHGVQSDRENYLIPVDANITSENYLRQRAVSVQVLLDELNDAHNELNVVVLDACRDNPFNWRRGGSRGLQVISSPPADSIIVYATSAGSAAADGEGKNGFFTYHLLNNLKTPGLEVSEVFRRTGADVSLASNREQIPEVYNKFFGIAYLGSLPAAVVTPEPPPASAAVQPAAPPQPAPVTVQPVTPSQPAPVTVQPAAPPPERPAPTNMVRIPDGTFQMGSTNGGDNEKPVHSVTVKSFYMGKYEVTQKEWREVMGTTVRQQRDMGDKSYDIDGEGDNYPMYYVSWYDAVEYCNRLSQREGLTPAYTIHKDRRDPGNKSDGYEEKSLMDNLKWQVTWNRNANGYRLPTEAEWEYACRAGTTSNYWSGNAEISLAGKANVGDQTLKEKYSELVTSTYFPITNIRDGYAETSPVGSFAANPWGLYDMHGNVWEWCWDWPRLYIRGSKTDPVGASSGSGRITRGGSWNDLATEARSANRNVYSPSNRYGALGFRLVLSF